MNMYEIGSLKKRLEWRNTDGIASKSKSDWWPRLKFFNIFKSNNINEIKNRYRTDNISNSKIWIGTKDAIYIVSTSIEGISLRLNRI